MSKTACFSGYLSVRTYVLHGVCLGLLLAVCGVSFAVRAAENSENDGVPSVLQYARKYSEEKQTPRGEQVARGKVAEKKAGRTAAGPGDTRALRRQVALREQELTQLRRELKRLRDASPAAEKSGVQAQLTTLQQEKMQWLKGQEGQTLAKAEKERATLLAEQKTQTGQDSEKVKALTTSLAEMTRTLADMPVVTPEILTEESAKESYAAGVMFGRDMLTLQAAQAQLGLKTDNRVLLAGIRDAVNRKVLLNGDALDAALTVAEEKAQKGRLKVIADQKRAGEAWLTRFRKDKSVRQDDSGFWYRMDYPGDGELIRGDETVVEVVVTEKLTDGTVVEDMDARGRSLSMALGDFPPLFRGALMLMKNHGTMTVVAPPALAYGDDGYPPKIPPGATVVYTLRVENVMPAPAIVLPDVRQKADEADRGTMKP
ncbi:FKBP-type peptidyl-prolyl cis-trans isomerase [Salmonella enterica]|nr:peptidylprolyl isomerase [Salmonella enterica]EFR3658199.1 peptidylprolyl isomerase [Salmonella enterica]EIE7706057.1 FKBP-type peptidyl-prolyl cis-trans isomerase [Salmonella enterica]EIN2108382.1 FKBP-type peptidyl-prolyl cis-trans isomerase [Salmonella enterica]EIO8764934.1 FKBP-type peptidyl-prolyl cis-trans isomerase [Salmonella enterica]